MALSRDGIYSTANYSGVSTSGAKLFSPGGTLHTGDCMLVLTIAHDATGVTPNPITSITDSQGNTWAKYTDSTAASGWNPAHFNGGGQRSFALEVWYAKNATCNTTISITVNHANAVDAASMVLSSKILGYNATQPFDQHASLPKKVTINSGSVTQSIPGISTATANVAGMWAFGAFSNAIATGNPAFNGVTRADQNDIQTNNVEFVRCQGAIGTPVVAAYSGVTYDTAVASDNTFLIGYALTADAAGPTPPTIARAQIIG